MGRISTDIDNIYLALARDLLKAPKADGTRDGDTRELNNVKITLKDITKNIVSIRGLSPSYLFGEMLWYFMGDNSLKFISKFSSFWNKLSDDGKTCNSAYGYLMMHKHGFNQIDKVIEILKKDPMSRRAKININTPNENVIETKDEPCTMSIHYMLRNNKLDCTVIMRSNDIWIGFPYDVAFFTELQKYIADQLGVGYGWYTHFAISLHLYDRDADKLAKVLSAVHKPIEFDRKKFHENIEMLYHTVIRSGKEAFMKKLKELEIYKEE